MAPKRAVAAPVAVPDGPVVQTTVLDPIYVDSINVNHMFRVTVDQPVQSGGKDVLVRGALVFLKVRILGPGPQPNTVRLSLTTDYVLNNSKQSPIASNEIVQTIKSSMQANVPGMDFKVPQGAKLSFTLHN